MPFEKGHERVGGRAKGSPNKVTTELKEMILGALEDAGGRGYLMKQANANPSAFLSLIGKYIPSELHQKLSGAIKVDGAIKFIRSNDNVSS